MVGKKTDLFIAQIQELVKLNSTVGEGTEGPLLLEVGGDLGVGNGGIGLRQPRKNVPSVLLHRLPHKHSGSTHHLEGVVGGLAVGLKAALLLGGFGTESETRPVAERLGRDVGTKLYSSPATDARAPWAQVDRTEYEVSNPPSSDRIHRSSLAD